MTYKFLKTDIKINKENIAKLIFSVFIVIICDKYIYIIISINDSMMHGYIYKRVLL